MKKYVLKDGVCGVEQVFKIVGARWKPSILETCYLMNGASLPELKKELPRCPETTLSRQINSLMGDEMLTPVSEGKTTVYQLTERAKNLMPVLTLTQRLAFACDFPNSGYDSTIEYAKALIGQKWKSRIIWAIQTCGPIRFNELQRSIDGISHKVLQEQLEDLLRHGLLEKKDYNESPPRTEYAITKTGDIAYELIQEFAAWAKAYGLIKVKVEISSIE